MQELKKDHSDEPATMKGRLGADVVRLIEQHERSHPADAGMLNELLTTYEELSSLPNEYDFRWRESVTPESLGANRVESVLGLMDELTGWLGFLAFSTAYKMRHLCEMFADGLRSRNYVATVLAARSMMEVSATLHFYAKQVMPPLGTVCSVSPWESAGAFFPAAIEAYKSLRQYAGRTRFNWSAGIQGNLDAFYDDPEGVSAEHRQPSIMKFIEALPQTQKGSTRFFYVMLCDFVHPNMGSHTLVIDRAMSTGAGTTNYVLSATAHSSELMNEVLHVVSIAVRHSLGVAKDEIRTLVAIYDSMRAANAGLRELGQEV
jgi:hypothetical protein